jgi:hypothetical protein
MIPPDAGPTGGYPEAGKPNQRRWPSMPAIRDHIGQVALEFRRNP